MICRYVNSEGREVNLLGANLKANGFLHGREWEAETTKMLTGEKVESFHRKAHNYSMTLTARGTRAERLRMFDTLCDIFEADVEKNQPGTLYYNDWYCECFITKSNPAINSDNIHWLDQNINIYVPSATWWHESTTTIGIQTGSASTLAYPLTYPFTYPISGSSVSIANDNYIDSDFKLIAYGPATGLDVTISGHEYKVNQVIGNGEYLLIDSRDGADADLQCVLVKSDGTKENCYNKRVGTILDKIPAGPITVNYSRAYGIDLTVLRGRSEPKWAE